MSRTKVCGEPGCPVLTSTSKCKAHAPAPWAGSRGRVAKSMSKHQWAQTRRYVLHRDNGQCYLCGGKATEVDHVVPVFEGGTDDLSNLRAICRTCHRSKSGREGARASQSHREGRQ